MRRPSRWEEYDGAGGRRPNKAELVARIVTRLLESELVAELTLDREVLTKDLNKLRIDTLAVLEDVVPVTKEGL